MSDRKGEENLDFKWLKKKGIGGKGKDSHFYDSFVLGGETYRLHDSVYFRKDGEHETCIGKLIKIWEQRKVKKVKVLCFFRPIKVAEHTGNAKVLEKVLENELFLVSSGKENSQGVTNINPLEAIAGKCNVICTSKDVKNPQPSKEDTQAANYIFYRTFNVDTFEISDRIDEKIASLQVKNFIYNRTDGKELGSGKTEENGKVGGSADDSRPPVKLNAEGLPENPSEWEKQNNSAGLEEDFHARMDKLLLDMCGSISEVSDDTSTTLVQEKGNLKPVNGSDEAARPSRKARVESRVKPTEEPQSKISKSLSLSKDKKEASPQITKKDGADDLDNVARETQNTVSNSTSLSKGKDKLREQPPSKKASIDSQVKPTEAPQSKISSPSLIKDKKVAGAPIFKKHSADNSGKLFKVPKPTISNMSSLGKGKDKPMEQPSEKAGDGYSTRTSKEPQPKISSLSSVNKEKNKDAVQASKKTRVNNPVNSSEEPQPTISTPSSLNKDQNEATVQPSQNGTMSSAPEDMNVSKIVVDTHGQEKATLKDAKSGGKKLKLSNENPSKPLDSRCTEKKTSTDDPLVEVGRSPQADQRKWFKELPCRERMERAQDHGKLILLDNLDPSYTSAEVEDIIWHSFKKKCAAKVVQKMAFSSPHSGRAFVIFETQDAAELVIEKLDDGCLMLPNGRPLVASWGSLPESGKASTLVGHLFIKKIKLQTRREDIEKAGWTHLSQPGTMEYDMALEWKLLQAQIDKCFKELYEQQGKETRELQMSAAGSLGPSL